VAVSRRTLSPGPRRLGIMSLFEGLPVIDRSALESRLRGGACDG